MSDNNEGLVELLLDDRIKGRNWLEIQTKHGIPAEEARQLVNETLNSIATKDPVEMRYLMQLRLEKIVDHLWTGLEAGSFKHGEAILKAIERMAELMDLNQDTIKHQLTIISDEETLRIFDVLNGYGRKLYEKVETLPLTPEAKQELEAWSEWTSLAATEAVEEALIVEEV